MNQKRKDDLWERIYNIDGFGLSDYLNDFFPVSIGSWRSTQHGEKVWLCVDGRESGYTWGAWSQWREQVSYYFDGMIDQAGRMTDESICNVLVYKLASMLLRLSPLVSGGIISDKPPKQAKRFLYM